MDIAGILDGIFDKVGVIYFICWFLWIIFLISLAGTSYSVRRYKDKCTYAKAEVLSFDEGFGDDRTIMYVKILGVKEEIKGPTLTPGDKNVNPVGSEIEVAYTKKGSKYEIRLADNMGDGIVKLFFVLQLLPLIAMAFLYIYSNFINPSFNVI